MKKYTPLLILLLFTAISLQSQTFSNDNFIYTAAPKKPVQAGNFNTLTKDEMSQNVTYFDGLGRPIQSIAIGQGANGEDIITPIEYDAFGRQVKEYLPYASSNGGNSYPKIDPTAAISAAQGFYSTEKYENTANPFSEKKLEASPLNRVLKQAAPGTSWMMGSGHEIKLDYQSNKTGDAVQLYKANTSWQAGQGLYEISFSDAGTYAENELYKNVIFDENSGASLSESAGSTVEFKNKEGQVVLKRTYDSGDKHDTYYVYDIYGNLTYVLPPKVSGTISNEVLNGLCYQYKYDNRNRLVEKKLPGKQWEFIVYDKLDRPVATGPSFSPFKDETAEGWLITKYDAFGRPVYTGWNNQSANAPTRKALQDNQNAATVVFETKQTSGAIDGIPVNYSNAVAPVNLKLLTVNYYDDYTYPNAPSIPTTIEDQDVLANAKGLATGNWTRVVTIASAQLGETTTTVYDDKGRPIRTRIQNHFDGYTSTDSKLDFTGKALYTITKHKRTSGDNELTIKEEFTYSPQDRLLTHTHQINAGIVQLLTSNSYDQLGQLESKNVGDSGGNARQKVDFSYNIRGWLTGINDTDNLQHDSDPVDLFAFKINYNNPSGNSAVDALYNGNIAETFWKTASDYALRSYGYNYDNLNRLKNAIYRKPNDAIPVSAAYNESLSYDKNGNIKYLQRYGDSDAPSIVFKIDDLTYGYLDENSNQLVNVTEGLTGNDNAGFIDANKTGDDYAYDANGNMISDKNKNITKIEYNHLNLPKKIIFGTTGSIEYIYNAVGQKLEKIVTDNSVVNSTNYLGGFQYKNNVLEFFPTAEGYVKNENGALSYVFQYKDHLGNVRVSYAKNPQSQVLEIIEENNYYPFGLKHKGYNDYLPTANKYKYNGKEWQDELGLNVTAMDFRQYDPAIGRFNSMDALAEEDPDFTPYRFAYDNPLYWNDPSGLSEEGSNDLTGWVNKGGKTFWDPRVNNAGDVDKLYGDTAKFVPDNTITPNGDGTSTQYNPDGTKTTLLQEVAITSKPKPKSESPGFSPWGPTLIGLGQPLDFLKPVGALGSKPGSSIASWTLSKAIPYRSPLLKKTTQKVVAKVVGKQVAKKVGTAVVGRALGRLVPYVGWGLLANDIYQNWDDVKGGLEAVKAGVETHSRLQENPETWVCFAKGTLVYTPSGLKPIEEIRTGDITYSYNLEEQKIESSKVMNTLNREVSNVFKIITNNETIFVTAEHPIYVIDKGWIKVKELKVGDLLKSFDGKAKIAILEIQEIKSPMTVYNIEVDSNHNYYITNSTILVHNKNITEIKEKSNSPLKK